MASRPLVKESLQLLHFTGLNPFSNDAFSKFRALVVTSLTTYLWFETCLFCFYKWEGFESLDALTSFSGIYEGLVKTYCIINQRQNIVNMLKKMDKLWPINKYGVHIENEIENILKLFKKTVKIMAIFILVALPAYFAKPFYGKVRVMPIHAYHPVDINKSPNFEIAYIYQVIALLLTCLNSFALDTLFLSLTITIICQFKILKEGIRKIPINIRTNRDSKITLSEIYILVNQHNLILDCIKDISEIYSMLLLQKYLNSMFCMCAGLLGIISSGIPPRMDVLYKDGSFVVFYALQLFFYCAAGSRLSEECASISAAVYNTQWYVKTQPKLRRAYVMMIQRANKTEELTAGGMFSLNLESFRKVIKAALSFFTLVEALYEDAK